MTHPPANNREFVERLQAHGNELRIAHLALTDRKAWRRAIYALINSDDVPLGQRLRHAGRDHGPLVIRLVPDTPQNQPRAPEYEAIRVPERLSRPHALITATSDACQRGSDGWVDTRKIPGVLHFRVAHSSVRRVLLITQALIDASLQRRWTVGVVKGFRCPGGLGIFVGAHGFELAFSEESDRSRHQPTKPELAEKERHPMWTRIPDWDYTPSGRLQLRIGHDGYGNTSLASDRTRWRLDDRLGRALALLEAAADEQEIRRLQEESARARREDERRAAVECAQELLAEARRADHLEQAPERWRLSRDIRALVADVRARNEPGVLDEGWLSWVEQYAARVDPARAFPAPEFTAGKPEELRPFLHGWSPYGPERIH